MNQLLTMIKMLMLTGAGWSAKGDNKKKKKTNIVAILFLIFIVIPLALALGFISFYMAYLLDGRDSVVNVISLAIGISGITMLFFGILMIPSVFYFSDDINYLLPMPIKSINIINSKLFTTWIWENLTSVFVFLPMMIGFAIGTKVQWYYWLYGIVIMFTLSIIPMLYGIILNILLIRFTSFGKNKSLLSYVMSTFSILFSVAISIYLLNNLYSGTGNIFYTLAISSQSLASIINKFFPFVTFASNAMVYGSFIDFAKYILLIIVFFTIYYICAKLFYYEGVLKLTSRSNNGKNITDKAIKKKLKRRHIFDSLVRKEIINLFINPSFFSGCISSNFIIPAIFLFIPHTALWSNIERYLYQAISYVHRDAYLTIFILGIALFTSGMNYISFTAISREGSDYQAMKYLPIEYEQQVFAKIAASFIISMITFSISIGIFSYYVEVNIFYLVMSIIVGILMIFFMSELGLLVDLYNPTVLWDDDSKAVKQNFNGMIGIFLSIIIVIGIGFLIVNFKLYLGTVIFILLNVMLLLDAFLGVGLYYSSEYFIDKM